MSISPTELISTGTPVTNCALGSGSPALPSGLSIDSTTCVISGTPTVAIAGTDYTIVASNAGGKSSPATLHLTIAALKPTIAFTTSPVSASFGKAITAITPSTLSANGAPITACTISPSPPAGLSLSVGTCVLSGTPTAVSASTLYSVTATNSAGTSIASTFTLGVIASVPTLSFTGATGALAIAGSTVNIAPTTLSANGAPVSSCKVKTGTTALPSGLTVNNTTCVISGTAPASASSATYSVVATNTAGDSATTTINITISPFSPTQAATLAGNFFSVGALDGSGNGARFFGADGMTADGTYLYVADTKNHMIRKVTISSGLTATLAGSAGTSGSTDGIGSAARFNGPTSLALARGGDRLYISDTGNCTIRELVIATKAVTTVAGSAGNCSFADGVGTVARFNKPLGITSDGFYNLFIADSGNKKVRTINILPSSPYTLTTSTIAGGNATVADGFGSAAGFAGPTALAMNGIDILVSDYSATDGARIRKITNADVTTLAGGSSTGCGNGTGSGASFTQPWGMASDGTNLVIADPGCRTIRKMVISTRVVTTVAGSGTVGSADGIGSAASFNFPAGMAFGALNFYVVDGALNGTGNNLIRKIAASNWAVTSIAGLPNLMGNTDGTGTAARLNYPYGITSDGTNLYVGDESNQSIRKTVIASGATTTLATGMNTRALANDGSTVYFADLSTHMIQSLTLSTNSVTPLAGQSGVSGSSDGSGSAASFNAPWGICKSGDSLYIADTGNHTIRRLQLGSNTVTTLAGLAGASGTTDGAGTSARFNQPWGLVSDGSNLYVADSGNHSIRKIVIATGVVSTLAGTSGSSGFVNANGSSARFYTPAGITIENANLHVTDAKNHAIRKVVIATGTVTTEAGGPTVQGDLNGSSLASGFFSPVGIVYEAKIGWLFITNPSVIRSLR